MATIKVTQDHQLDLATAKEKARALMARMKEKFGGMIAETAWTADGARGTASGKLFSAEFVVGERQVSLTVDLKGIGGRLLAPKVESDSRRILQKTFGTA
ncbi:MAG: polyhydroxyalkanoic acid system family protein [Deltaproteobacteria bacterium]|nr:polyhydroxyalkanoic acid system family protein [Deltaproteobacteria bacterium]